LAWLKNLFGGSQTPATEAQQPVGAVAAIMDEGKDGPRGVASPSIAGDAIADYQLFMSRRVDHNGNTFADLLSAPKSMSVREWFGPENLLPEPLAIARLVNAMAERGEVIADVAGISLLVQSRDYTDGAPEKESQDALLFLARSIGKPIKVMFKIDPAGEFLVTEYLPTS